MFNNFLRSQRIPRLCRLNSSLSPSEALEKWIASPKQRVLEDAFHAERMGDLYITLPTRDGTRKSYEVPLDGNPVGYGHHLAAFFHPRTPEARLREDGTDPDFGPPAPYTQRMWAGGRIRWNDGNPLLIGRRARAESTVTDIKKKESKGTPLLFLTQTINIVQEGSTAPSVVEERDHVYLPKAEGAKTTREVKSLPSTADFSFTYTPSLTTLFRFSALMFNAHHIHLDKDYTQKYDGYPERLVHGPLTALMLLETVTFQQPGSKIKAFEYRARNPMIVGRETTINGVWRDEKKAEMWCVDEDGVVGMTGMIEVA
ncbi:hypothetical protein BD779DRAFT_1436776 [Infundibulicybe gibba]|nr:hypothetical protein BD779DRAFT_1436776 [Infundibulicybe gibba]